MSKLTIGDPSKLKLTSDHGKWLNLLQCAYDVAVTLDSAGPFHPIRKKERKQLVADLYHTIDAITGGDNGQLAEGLPEL